MPALAVRRVGLVPVKLPGPLAMPSATWSVLSVVTTLPNGSSILTVTAAAMGIPAVVVVGCWPNTRWLATAGVTVTKLLLPLTPIFVVSWALMAQLPVDSSVPTVKPAPLVSVRGWAGTGTRGSRLLKAKASLSLGTVLLYMSWAVTWIRNALPAVMLLGDAMTAR